MDATDIVQEAEDAGIVDDPVEEIIEEEVVEEEETVEESTEEETPDKETPDDNMTKLAKEWGWNSKGEDDAETYVRNERAVNESLKKRSKRQEAELAGMSREIVGVREMLKEFKTEQGKRGAIEINRTIDALRQDAEEAFTEDRDKYDAIQKQIVQYESMLPGDDGDEETVDTTAVSTDPNQAALADWKENNDWYESDEELTAFADGVSNRLGTQHPDWSLERNLKEVTKVVDNYRGIGKPKEEETTEENKPAAVASSKQGKKAKGGKRKASHKDLTGEEAAAGRRWVRAGTHKNLDEYAQELYPNGK